MMVAVRTRVERAIETALRDTAASLAVAAEPLKEKEFAGYLRAALSKRLDGAQTGCKVDAGEFNLELKEWPGVGRVDLAIRTPRGDPFMFFELKWGSGSLSNCVWDLAKMAVAVARGSAYKAYLVAGAPDTDWGGALGSELFTSSEWTAGDLLERYRKHWDFWKGDVKTHPVALPHTMRTSAVFGEHLQISGEPWCLRAAEVAASPEDWVDVSSGIRASRWLTHFSWQPGDVDVLTPAEAKATLGERPSNPKG